MRRFIHRFRSPGRNANGGTNTAQSTSFAPAPGNGQTNPRLSLHEAASQGLTHMILWRLGEGAAINALDGNGSTALFLAIKEGHIEAVEVLLNWGADIETPCGPLSARPIHVAAMSLSPTMVATLLRYRPNLEARSNGLTALYYAIGPGNEEVVRLLLEAGADATARTLCEPGTGESVLHMAVGWWREAMLPLFIAYGADVNARGTNPAGQTALHMAAQYGNEEALRELIKAGADVFAKYDDGNTALDVAASEGHIGTASILLDHGMDIVAEHAGGRRISPMYLAAIHNREGMVQFLLDRCGSAISEEAKIRVVIGAAATGRLGILKMLNAKGFPIFGRNEFVDSGLGWAAHFGHKDVVVYLLRQGADIQIWDVQLATSGRQNGTLGLLREAERKRAANADAELFPGWVNGPEPSSPSSELSQQARLQATAISVSATRRIHANQVPAGHFCCDVCKDLDFRRGMPADAEVVYYMGIVTMSSSARRGCRGCQFLSDCLAQARRAYGENLFGIGSITHITLHSMALGAPLLLHANSGNPTKFPQRRVEIYVEEGTSTSWPTVGTGRDVSLSGWPDERAEIARKFVEECIANHSHCWYREGPLPTRVIRVGSANEEPRLHISSGEHAKYVTLSHCWGGVSPLTTTTSTLRQRIQTIHFRELPKTFRDAVIITRSLGVAYLWIDSLCILQDSTEDWRKEAAKMKDVYANCYAMIAADDSINPHGGCFTSMADVSRISYPVNSLGPWFSKVRAFVRLTHLRDPFHMEVCHRIGDPAASPESSRGVLNRRGWCLQERVLAPRVLHFGRSEFAWECPTTVACECQGTITPSLDKESRFKALLADQIIREGQLGPGSSGASGQVDILLWIYYVEEFTRRQLSHSSDILHALSGLASYMAAVTRADYFCGIWKTQLAEFLLWRVDYGKKYPVPLAPQPFRLNPISPTAASIPIRPRRHESYHAPSWSWASVIGPIAFLRGRLDLNGKDQMSHIRKDGALERVRKERISLLGVVEMECVADPLNPFGPPRHASMIVSGQTVSVTWEHKKKSRNSDYARSENGGTLVYRPTFTTGNSTSSTITLLMADFEPDLADEDLDVSIGDSLLLLYVIMDLDASLVKVEGQCRLGMKGARLEGLVLAPDSTAGGKHDQTVGQTMYRRVGVFEATDHGWQEVATTNTVVIV